MAYFSVLFQFLFVLTVSIPIIQGQEDAVILPAPGNSRYHSAKCIALSARCSQSISIQSGVCKAGLSPDEQSEQCMRRACSWCAIEGKKEIFPCTSENFVYCQTQTQEHVPSNPAIPTPPTTGEPTDSTSGHCEWVPNGEKSNERIVIDLGTVIKPGQGWMPITREGYKGLIYEKTKNHGTDPAGSRGIMCFDVLPMVDGDYFFSGLSYAPMGAHNNDVWVLSSKGFGLWQGGNLWMNVSGTAWSKAYQNDGPDNFGMDFKTRDGNGHRFIIPGVKGGEKIQVCVSGRSFRYELFRLVLAVCKGKICTGRRFFGFDKWAVSQCLE